MVNPLEGWRNSFMAKLQQPASDRHGQPRLLMDRISHIHENPVREGIVEQPEALPLQLRPGLCRYPRPGGRKSNPAAGNVQRKKVVGELMRAFSPSTVFFSLPVKQFPANQRHRPFQKSIVVQDQTAVVFFRQRLVFQP
jgi:hypothetical protein